MTPTSRYQAVVDGSTQVLCLMVANHAKVGTHPYYDAATWGVERCQAVASRCDQEMHQLAEEAAYVQLAHDLGGHDRGSEAWHQLESMLGRRRAA